MGNHKGSPNDEQFHSVTILNEYYEGVNGIHQICVKDDSNFLGQWAIDKTSLMTAVESCAGLGVGAIRLQRAGFDVVAANDISKPLMEAYAKLHPGVEVVVGDIRHEPTLVALHDAAPTAAVLAAGFSCQPFSSGGLKRGSGDDRSCSLPGILRAALLLRKPILILECVANAATNRFVRCHLETFCQQCGYGMSEVILKLEDVWVSKRDRWWAVLVVTTLGVPNLRGFVPGPYPCVVKDILPRPLPLSDDEIAQPQFSADERSPISHWHPAPLANPLRSHGVFLRFGIQISALDVHKTINHWYT